jgi:hypothetical protein
MDVYQKLYEPRSKKTEQALWAELPRLSEYKAV